MAVGTYLIYLILVRDETDSGYYAFMSTNSNYYANNGVHVSDASGYISIQSGNLVIDAKSIFPKLTSVNQAAGTAVVETIV